MPWWGWLIAVCVAAICLTTVAVVAVMTSTMRTLGQDVPRVGERRPHEPLWRSSETRQERRS